MNGWVVGGIVWLGVGFAVSWLWGSLARFGAEGHTTDGAPRNMPNPEKRRKGRARQAGRRTDQPT